MASRVALLGRQCRFTARGAHQAAQVLHVAIGVGLHPARQRLVVGQQRVAPALGLVQQQRVACRAQLGLGHGFAQRLGFPLPPVMRAWRPAVATLAMVGVLIALPGLSPWIAIPLGGACYGIALITIGGLRLSRTQGVQLVV